MKITLSILSALLLAMSLTASAQAADSFADSFFETQRMYGENLRTNPAFGLDGHGN